MKKRLAKKICLGTAQFGFDYGIANKKGRIKKEEAFRILDYARRSGIDTLDTAYMYGESEGVLGEFIKGRDGIFRVISKFTEIDGFLYPEAEKLFSESMKRLGIKKIYGYMTN